MAIKIRTANSESYNVKKFANRIELRKAFWARYDKMVQEGSVIISFYGAGGVGKTALLRKLEEEVTQYNAILKRYYVKYDFSIGTDVRDVLKTFKFQLSNYGCKFPLFDIGNYYYSLTIGQDIEAPKVQSMFEQLPLVQELKKKLSKASVTAGNVKTIFDTTKKIFNAATDVKEEHWLEQFLRLTINGLSTSMPLMRTITIFMSLADTFLEEYMKRKGILDTQHQFIRNQLNDRRQRKDPVALYEYLPTLFAMDVADWMAETDSKLIVFLDNYESLVGTTNFTSTEQRKRDMWLRGYDGLMYNIPNTLWTIAGRNELLWTGEIAEELEQHKISELSYKDSRWFLEQAGISEENLLKGLVELTKGYPIFLDLCVDFYVEYKRQHADKVPSIEEFGQKHEEVVGRILRYIDASDPIAKDMLEFLCALNVWTDEIAIDIGSLFFNYFSRNVYERVKHFSFIQSECIENEDRDFEVFQFDKTIQSLLIVCCDEKFVADLKETVNEHFKKFFTAKKTFNVKESFYLKFWAEFIVRFTDDAEELLNQYKDTLAEQVLTLTKNVHFDAAEEILMLFMNKLENLGVTNTLSYTYFEMDLGGLRRNQGHYKESYEITNSAYEKRARLLGDEHKDTVETMHRLAISLNDLGRYDEAVKFYERVLELRKNSLGEEHNDTVETMHMLAVSLNDLGRYNEALELREKVLTLRKKIRGEKHSDTIAAMNNLAVSLSFLGRDDQAWELRKKVLELSKNICGEEHPDTIAAMNNLAISLSTLNRHEEALTLEKQVFALYEKIFGEEHPETIAAMNNLALSLSNLKRYEEALELQEKVLSLYNNILGETHPHTLFAMNNLATLFGSLKRYEEALKLQEKVLRSGKKIFSDENADNIMIFMNNLAISLSILERYEEALPLQEQVLKSYKNNFGEENIKTITAMDNLALSLSFLKRYDEALPLQEKVLSLHRKNLGEEDPVTLDDADAVAYTLNKLGHHTEAIALQRDTLAKCKKIFDDTHSLTVTLEKNLAEMLLDSGEREEARQMIEQAFPAAQKIFGDEHSKTKEILKLREKILND